VRRVLTGFFSVLLLGHLALIGSAQSENISILESWASEEISGPVWLHLECEEISCPGMELRISKDGENTTISDLHEVEWSGLVNSSLSWEVRADSSSIGYNIESIYPYRIIQDGQNGTENLPLRCAGYNQNDFSEDLYVEIGDFPNLVRPSIDDSVDFLLSESVLVGSLENGADKDAMEIDSSPGDIIELEYLIGSAKMDIEIWDVQENGKSLVESLGVEDVPGKLLEYPMIGELWIRIIHDGEDGYHPYKLEYSRYRASLEGPDCKEIGNPWSNGEGFELRTQNPLVPTGQMVRYGGLSYNGHISSFDNEGDSLLIQVGSDVLLDTRCDFSGDVNISVFLHQLDNTVERISSGSESCSEKITTGNITNKVEFRFTASSVISWEITVWTADYGDSIGVGDAPEYLWESGDMLTDWPVAEMGNENSGSLKGEDRIDVYALYIAEGFPENKEGVIGAKVALTSSQGLESTIRFQIQSLNQTDWRIENSSNGSPIELPFGVHAIRVEGTVNEDYGGEYAFTVILLGPVEDDASKFEDLSGLFSDFYILVGLVLLMPLMIVLWWDRNNLWTKDGVTVEIERHEKRRLRRLRERIVGASTTEESGERIIENALSQLAGSAWEGVIEDWGEPMVSHNTGNVEIKAWRLDEGSQSLLIGIRIDSEAWDLAAISIHSPEGASAIIGEVFPKHLFQDSQIYLGKLEPNSVTFLRVGIDGSPKLIGFQLSGLVKGEPFAATPIKALTWHK